MDEKLIFDGVIKILHPTGFHSFLYAIADGGDQRYGRLLWNLIALFSYIPSKIWGIQAIIFSERLLGAVVIILGSMLLARIFTKNRTTYFAMVTAIVVLPFTTYYATTPKPESFILIFIALYLQKSKKSRNMLGSQWIYLGFIVGLKVSGLFIIFATIVFLQLQFLISKTKLKKVDLQISIAFLSIGFAIAVPTLYAFAVFGASILLITKLSLKKLPEALAFVTSAVLSIIILVISGRLLRNYFEWVIGSSRHGSDSKLINYRAWINYIFEVYFQRHMFILLILILTVLFSIYKIVIGKNAKILEVLLPLTLAIATTLPIIFYVERLWGFYLWTGSIFVVITIHNIVMQAKLSPKGLLILLLISTVAITLGRVNPIKFSETEIRDTLALESSSNFRLQNLRFTKVTDILNIEKSAQRKAITVAFDPLLWIPESTEKYQINTFWGPYTEWDKPIDLLVLTDLHTPEGVTLQDRNLSARESEITGYRKYVRKLGSPCHQPHCYFVAHQFDGVVVLKLRA
jgi:hypothetical protein